MIIYISQGPIFTFQFIQSVLLPIMMISLASMGEFYVEKFWGGMKSQLDKNMVTWGRFYKLYDIIQRLEFKRQSRTFLKLRGNSHWPSKYIWPLWEFLRSPIDRLNFGGSPPTVLPTQKLKSRFSIKNPRVRTQYWYHFEWFSKLFLFNFLRFE